ncbi:hypothetical protein [Romboutsia sp. 1001713B170207_170306_H8]|uniref:hypothetical protein n=1 Tax=Romboutsia sp. 1001713B170207_170306_H8 TaxID=2787112 RepID=UPI00189AD2A9|nr:hypothetical protein [Romboutsia sp. 1001713B170207_170306_H8]
MDIFMFGGVMKEEMLRISEKLLLLKKINESKLEYIKGYVDAKLYEEELKKEE